jgi:hypothetical protein
MFAIVHWNIIPACKTGWAYASEEIPTPRSGPSPSTGLPEMLSPDEVGARNALQRLCRHSRSDLRMSEMRGHTESWIASQNVPKAEGGESTHH